ncbi:MAG: tyrosine--tRNA ligase [Bacilli bacterium]|jgi:tyrosyl-tRNA synthetase|nr:tyrosine--tRNA ligase [Bacilli bacterium]MCH4210221.1 tyrosine--tRNA ligase [Bacilli bacterium]MCH4228403.1 tyrosine--tRNA ligase [Bacilli bacterium]MCH4277910.1 tyrosine--tRNA ligase [Bacilli bacterium]MCI2054902.1 tyrosine--tRNA ligase [Bacilli bacterium]
MSNVIDDLNYRGLIEQYSSEDNVRKLLDTKQTIYCGFDPSASSMHLGNYVMISTLMRLQRAGHKIIAVVGGATGMIGDPSGKSKERNLQNEDTLKANTECIRSQLERFLDLSDPEKGLIVNNYDWLGHMETLDFLREYGKFFSINYMLSKEIVSSRLESGISFTEFAYQILQSIDFLTLYRKYGCRIQIGGNDQWGNLTSGLELIRKVEGENASAECMTAHLLLRSDGKKFGKSEQGALFLNPEMTSPYHLYQYFINSSDEDAVRYLKVLTFLSKDEIEALTIEHLAHPGERIAQKKLAYEVTKDIHGEQGVEEAIKMSEVLFSGDVASLKENEIIDLLGGLQKGIAEGMSLLDILVAVGAAPSKTQGRTFVVQNSVSINGMKVTDPDKHYGKADALYGKYLVIRRGKKNYYLGEF